MKESLFFFNLEIVVLKPSVSIPRVIVVNHSLDISWVVPKVAKSSRDVVTFTVVFMSLVTQVSCEKSKAFSNIL